MPAPANLLLFLSDNHNRALAGCYGHPKATTPNLDRIAASGVRFANAYSASPLCCPARAAIATGRFPHQTGFFDNAIVYDGSVPSWMPRPRATRRGSTTATGSGSGAITRCPISIPSITPTISGWRARVSSRRDDWSLLCL